MIDLQTLDKETRDRLELKESMDMTYENALEEDYTDIMFDTLDARRDRKTQHSYLASLYGMQGSGKSYGGLFMAGYTDPKFNVDKIYFDINKLVYDRANLKPNTAILVDEQSRQYGLDSQRIVGILHALKEQLRKKSIHMFYCSPTLKDDYTSSMYILETMFLDKEMKENYFAYKTNELQCLGYVIIPHPLKVISKKLLLEYENKKDEHLEHLTTQPTDEIAERSKKIMEHKVFINLEKLYVEKKGYVPSKMVIQIINKIYPEFKSSVVVYELADRIRMEKETSAEWIVK